MHAESVPLYLCPRRRDAAALVASASLSSAKWSSLSSGGQHP